MIFTNEQSYSHLLSNDEVKESMLRHLYNIEKNIYLFFSF